MNDSLGDRMKAYEKVYDYKLTPNSCLFIRVDGKAFHTFTRSCDKPFDRHLIHSMILATEATAEQMQGFKAAYVQSDEATFMLTDFDTHQTQGWFGYELNKVVSITASMFTAYFNAANDPTGRLALFDARAFIVPKEDAPNVFIWRQQDWARNSVQMVAQSVFSHNQLHGKNIPTILDMLYENGTPWEHYNDVQKYGTFVFKDERQHRKYNYDELKGLIMPQEKS